MRSKLSPRAACAFALLIAGSLVLEGCGRKLVVRPKYQSVSARVGNETPSLNVLTCGDTRAERRVVGEFRGKKVLFRGHASRFLQHALVVELKAIGFGAKKARKPASSYHSMTCELRQLWVTAAADGKQLDVAMEVYLKAMSPEGTTIWEKTIKNSASIANARADARGGSVAVAQGAARILAEPLKELYPVAVNFKPGVESSGAVAAAAAPPPMPAPPPAQDPPPVRVEAEITSTAQAPPPPVAPPPAGFEKQLIAVMSVTAENEDLGGTATSALRTALLNTSRFKMVDRKNMESILSEQEFQMADCSNSECAVQVGQLLGVQGIVTGEVRRVGRTLFLAVQLTDVETGVIKRAADARCKCEDDEIFDLIDRVVYDLVNTK